MAVTLTTIMAASPLALAADLTAAGVLTSGVFTAAADSSGFNIPNSGDCLVILRNTWTSNIIVGVDTPGTVEGLNIQDPAVTLVTVRDTFLVFPARLFNYSTQQVKITITTLNGGTAANVLAAVIKLPEYK